MPALVAALNDPKPAVRARAANALGNIGPTAVGAVPALAAALNDPEHAVQWRAAGALARLRNKQSS
jgi:HEAT repeat protein